MTVKGHRGVGTAGHGTTCFPTDWLRLVGGGLSQRPSWECGPLQGGQSPEGRVGGGGGPKGLSRTEWAQAQRKQILRTETHLWTDVGLSILPSRRQDPRTLVSCIDFRYITDVLTEEEACGELSPHTGSFRVYFDLAATRPRASLSKRVWRFLFFPEILRQSQVGKKERGGLWGNSLIIFLSLCTSAGPCRWGLTSRPPLHPPQMVGYGCSSLQGLRLRSGFTSATARSRAGFRVTLHNRGRLGQRGLPEGNLAPVWRPWGWGMRMNRAGRIAGFSMGSTSATDDSTAGGPAGANCWRWFCFHRGANAGTWLPRLHHIVRLAGLPWRHAEAGRLRNRLL